MMTLVTVDQEPTPCQVLYTSDLSACFCACVSASSPIFQMRRPNQKEIRALSHDSWGLFKWSGPEATGAA